MQQFGGGVDSSFAQSTTPNLTGRKRARRHNVLVVWRFGASQYPSANYSIRINNDQPIPARQIGQAPAFKAGEASYFKDFGTGDNRWGDYSNVAIDSVNDRDLWTIQEYAGTGNTWGTWWGTIALSEPIATPTATATPHADPDANPLHRSRDGPRSQKRSPKPKRDPDRNADLLLDAE